MTAPRLASLRCSLTEPHELVSYVSNIFGHQALSFNSIGPEAPPQLLSKCHAEGCNQSATQSKFLLLDSKGFKVHHV